MTASQTLSVVLRNLIPALQRTLEELGAEQKREDLELMSVSESREAIGMSVITEGTLYRWCKDGTIPCVKNGNRIAIRRDVVEKIKEKGLEGLKTAS